MISNINHTPLRLFNSVEYYWKKSGDPYKLWEGKMNYHLADPQIHYDHGFRPYVAPEINAETHRLGDLIIDEENDVVTRELIALTDEELKSRLLSTAQGSRETIIQERMRQSVEAEFQAMDDTEALENQAAFPFWREDISVLVDEKYQAFDGLELKLYRVEQSHTTQVGWEPNITPALFTRIAAEGEILPWTQPTGAQDTYQVGDQVTHNGSTWQSTAADNVWEPGVFGWTQVS